MPHQQAASVELAFERALEEILARVCVFTASCTELNAVRKIAIAYSGGLDSSVLLHLAQRYAANRNIALSAFHVHHGLSVNADQWLSHCEDACTRLGIRFEARHVNLPERRRDGTEQAARLRRYAALGEMCRSYDVPLLLTAHHLDDQAETVLLQLLRGSGVAGLSGMEEAGTAPDLLGDPRTVIGRPLLHATRTELERLATTLGIEHVDDESNRDVRYVRNALRHTVLPLLAERFPGFQQRFARSARHAQAAQRILDDVAAEDLATCQEGECIDLKRLQVLSEDRIDNLLRHWLAQRGARMPSTAWLGEMRAQLLGAKEDAQILVTHADGEIRRHRNRVFFTARKEEPFEERSRQAPVAFRWNGEQALHFKDFGGVLYFHEAEEGVDADWLRAQDLLLCHRNGGEKLKTAPDRPARSLKHHYQALDIPAWERPYLPLVVTGKRLIYAAGIGMNVRDVPHILGKAISLRWEKTPE